MIRGRKIIALIPARGGSKGIKDKNIVLLKGKPLIQYSIDAAKNSKYIDRIIVSTDSKKIAEVAKSLGAEVPFLRPVELASDNSKTIEVVLHAVHWLEDNQSSYDALVLLQPTQPLRTSGDIDDAIEKYLNNGENSLVSVCKVSDNPILIRTIDDSGLLVNLLDRNSTIRRQDMPEYYKVNGAIYINKIEDLKVETSFNDNTVPYIMREDHSVDIDDISDLDMAEWIMSKNQNRND